MLGEFGWIAWLVLGGLALFLLFRRRGPVAGHEPRDVSGGHGDHRGHEDPVPQGGNVRKHSRGGCC